MATGALLLMIILVIVAYLISRQLFPHQPAMRLTISILVAFQPMMSQMTAVITVDGFFFLTYSIFILLSILVFRDGLNWKMGALIGIVSDDPGPGPYRLEVGIYDPATLERWTVIDVQREVAEGSSATLNLPFEAQP